MSGSAQGRADAPGDPPAAPRPTRNGQRRGRRSRGSSSTGTADPKTPEGTAAVQGIPEDPGAWPTTPEGKRRRSRGSCRTRTSDPKRPQARWRSRGSAAPRDHAGPRRLVQGIRIRRQENPPWTRAFRRREGPMWGGGGRKFCSSYPVLVLRGDDRASSASSPMRPFCTGGVGIEGEKVGRWSDDPV